MPEEPSSNITDGVAPLPLDQGTTNLVDTLLPPRTGEVDITLDNTVKSRVRQLIKESMSNNPYFAAGGGLMILGSGLAILRSSMIKLSRVLYKQMIVDLEIPSRDKSYQWFLNWMSEHPQRISKHLSVSTKFLQRDNGAIATQFKLVPGPGSHWLWYHGAIISIKRERSGRMIDLVNSGPYETIKLTTLYRDRHLFQEILKEAQDIALKGNEGKTVIYTSFGPEWRKFGQPKNKRALSSVVLDKGLDEKIINDVKGFLGNGKWYSERGIPYRRGYLLYGPPGSGKTSFIQALAGELDYNICILNLSEQNLTDDRLNHLMNNMPERSILLLEDIDAAFKTRAKTDMIEHSLNVDQPHTNVTFSGLLNALDGVASSEETITFMTTNHREKLDPAIMRPGRIDFHIFVGNATPYQAEKMFVKFYPGEINCCQEFVTKFKSLITAEDNKVVNSVSTAQLQGLFIMNKDNPQGALDNLSALVRQEIYLQ